MDLSKYEAMVAREMVIEPFPISDEELCTRYEDLYTGAVNDVLREEGMLAQTLPNTIMPLRDEMKVCGIAFTVKGASNLTLVNEMKFRAEMLEAITANSVVVWDTSGDTESAQWGEIMTLAARKRGCRGAVIDGGIRDTNMVLSQNFPVFCKYRSSNGMLGRFRMISYLTPIVLGSVTIFPGDVVFGDIDGVLVVPRAYAYDILIRAEAIKRDEVGIRSMVDSGMSPKKVVEQGGYF